MLKRILLALFISASYFGSAQMVISNAPPYNNPQWLVQNVLLDTTVTMIPPTPLAPNSMQIGYFTASIPGFEIDSGLCLVSSYATSLSNQPPPAGWVAPGPGTDADLSAMMATIGLPGASLHNVVKIEFDFIAVSDSVKFNYIFSSEEYAGFTCSSFNDAFGLFLTGPGINNNSAVTTVNLAQVPNTNPPVPICVNSINSGAPSGGSNALCLAANPNFVASSAYWLPHTSGSSSFVSTGYTKKLTARAKVVCGQQYHMKLAISNTSDGALQSGVFLEEGSFKQLAPALEAFNPFPDAENDSTIAEGCSYAALKFSTKFPASDTTRIYYSLGGTAINGVDYDSLPGYVTFFPGMNEKHLIIAPKKDMLIEGDETVIIEIADSSCVAAGSIKQYIIRDKEPLQVNIPDTVYFCETPVLFDMDGSVITGGQPPYHYQWEYKGQFYNHPNFIGYTWVGDTAHLYIYDDCYAGQTFEKTVYFHRPDTCPEPPIVDSIAPLTFPNTFSPNGDGVNDYFYVKGLDTHDKASIQIFNRWGIIVYENNDFHYCSPELGCWDGTDQSSGNPVADGVYYYILNYTSDGISKSEKGEVTVFRGGK